MVDTVGRVKIASGTGMTMEQGADGKMSLKMTINPLVTVDDWSVLTDGTLAMVRGHDYHVDVVNPSGEATKGAKLPFDWKRLTDEDKQALVDSARTANENAQKAAAANGSAPGTVSFGGPPGGGAAGGGTEVRVMVMAGGSLGGGGGTATVGGDAVGGAPMGQPMNIGAPKIDFVPLKEIADYYPAIRPGAARPDLDGNLWILANHVGAVAGRRAGVRRGEQVRRAVPAGAHTERTVDRRFWQRRSRIPDEWRPHQGVCA
jgi:hypothetical protein